MKALSINLFEYDNLDQTEMDKVLQNISQKTKKEIKPIIEVLTDRTKVRDFPYN
jgi:hypothetical protein